MQQGIEKKSGRNFLTNSIILKTVKHKDYDRIATLLSEDIGVINVYFFGAERLKSRYVSTIIPFTTLKIHLYYSKNQEYISSKDIQEVEIKYEILKDLNSTFLATFYCEIISKTLMEESEYKKYFLLLKYTLDILNKPDIYKKSKILSLIFFTTKLIILHGQSFDYNRCSICDKKGDYLYFSKEKWEIYCEDDRSKNDVKIPYQDIDIIQKISKIKFAELRDFDFSLIEKNIVVEFLVNSIQKLYLGQINTKIVDFINF